MYLYIYQRTGGKKEKKKKRHSLIVDANAHGNPRVIRPSRRTTVSAVTDEVAREGVFGVVNNHWA
jgi:hypothetical protein